MKPVHHPVTPPINSWGCHAILLGWRPRFLPKHLAPPWLLFSKVWKVQWLKISLKVSLTGCGHFGKLVSRWPPQGPGMVGRGVAGVLPPAQAGFQHVGQMSKTYFGSTHSLHPHCHHADLHCHHPWARLWDSLLPVSPLHAAFPTLCSPRALLTSQLLTGHRPAWPASCPPRFLSLHYSPSLSLATFLLLNTPSSFRSGACADAIPVPGNVPPLLVTWLGHAVFRSHLQSSPQSDLS